MKNFELPSEPIEGYAYTYYRFYIDEYSYSIYEMKLVYHVNTKWNDFAPANKGGKDIIDEWMVYSNGNPSGRWIGWNGIPNHIFLTPTNREDTIKQAIEECDKQINCHQDKIDKLKKVRETIC